jgi:hypothetical protein
MSKISAFLTELKSSVEDFSQLNVRTFSGDLNTSLTGISSDLSNLDELLKQGVTDGNLKLQASSTLKIDGDIDQFITTNISGSMKEVHESAVETGKEYRTSIISLFSELV